MHRTYWQKCSKSLDTKYTHKDKPSLLGREQGVIPLLSFFFKFVCLFVYFERDQDRASEGGAERERERERISSRLMLSVQSLSGGLNS